MATVIDHDTRRVLAREDLAFHAGGAGCDAIVAAGGPRGIPERDEFDAWMRSDPRRLCKLYMERDLLARLAALGQASYPATQGDLARFDQDVIVFWGVLVERAVATAIAWKLGDEAAVAEALGEQWQWDVPPQSDMDEAEAFLAPILDPEHSETPPRRNHDPRRG